MITNYAYLLDRLPLLPGQTLLDVGSGSGVFTLEVAERLGLTGRVYAADPDRDSLEQLLLSADRKGLHTIVGIETDFSDTVPVIQEGSVDIVTLIWTLPWINDLDVLLQSIKPLLKPTGVVAILGWTVPLVKNFPSTEHLIKPSSVKKWLLGYNLVDAVEHAIDDNQVLIIARNLVV